jgi:hypothetical protein
LPEGPSDLVPKPQTNNVGIIAFVEMTKRSKSAGTVLQSEDQLDVRHADGGKCDLRTKIKQQPGISITSDFFPSLRTD